MSQSTGPSLLQTSTLSSAAALKLIQSAATYATSISVPQNIAVVDLAGLLIAFMRMDGAYPGSVDISIKKARTCVLFNGVTSGGLMEATCPGGALYGIEQTNGGLVVFGGGLPIFMDGKLVGAVGVSGGTVQEDIDVAQAGVDGVGARISKS